MASPTNTFFIVEMLIIEWSITYYDVTPESRIASFILLLVQRLCKWMKFHKWIILLILKENSYELILWMNFAGQINFRRIWFTDKSDSTLHLDNTTSFPWLRRQRCFQIYMNCMLISHDSKSIKNYSKAVNLWFNSYMYRTCGSMIN